MGYTIIVIIITINKGEVMEQLELPLKFKPNTYESYTDIQKKEYWETNYNIQLQKIDMAVRMLEGLMDIVDESIPHSYPRITVKGRIRKICNDLKDK